MKTEEKKKMYSSPAVEQLTIITERGIAQSQRSMEQIEPSQEWDWND